MKLRPLLDTPVLTTLNLMNVEDYIFDIIKYGKVIPYDEKRYFNIETQDYLHGLKKKIPLDKEFIKVLKYVEVAFDDKKALITISISTNASKLSVVKDFLADGLLSSSTFNEVKGKKNMLQDEYVYTLKIDLFDGKITRKGDKLSNDGILRVVYLIDLLYRSLAVVQSKGK